MPLKNRVSPFGTIEAYTERGLFMGNRGRIHDPETRELTGRPFALKAWLICRIHFNDRQRIVMGQSYTELFFLDEVTALAAGHRPCFECRRQAFYAYQRAFARHGSILHRAGDMDKILHAERILKGQKRVHSVSRDRLVDGAMIEIDGDAFAIKDQRLLRWSFGGYKETVEDIADLPPAVKLLTPLSTSAALSCGYQPVWHESALKP